MRGDATQADDDDDATLVWALWVDCSVGGASLSLAENGLWFLMRSRE